jgi:hypothetical protein
MERSTGRGSVLRAGLERRKYTLQRHPAGCLEHDHFVTPEMLGKERGQAQGIRGCEKSMAQGSRERLESGHEIAHRRQELRVEIDQCFGNLSMQHR